MSLVILDRDGVINYDAVDHIKEPAEWRPIPGSLEAIARLNRAGYRVVVATNQSGLARGLLDPDALFRIHQKMDQMLGQVGGRVHAVFFCPHGPDAGCRCRKPAPGLLEDASRRLNTTLDDVPMVGDSRRDVEAAVAAGARPVLVETGNDPVDPSAVGGAGPVAVYADLAAFVDAFLKRNAGG